MFAEFKMSKKSSSAQVAHNLELLTHGKITYFVHLRYIHIFIHQICIVTLETNMVKFDLAVYMAGGSMNTPISIPFI